jgi:alpha-ribazole phosphatase
MQRWDDIGAGELKVWTENFVNQRCPEGESYRDQFQRVASFWDAMCRKHQEHVAVVTHAGVIRALLAYLLDIPLHKSLYVGIDYGSVTKIHLIEDVPIIDYINR